MVIHRVVRFRVRQFLLPARHRTISAEGYFVRPPNGPTLVGRNVGRSVAIAFAMSVRRFVGMPVCWLVRWYIPLVLHPSQPTVVRWFRQQINSRKSQLPPLCQRVIACGVEMIAFGVFGSGNAASEASTFVPKRQGVPYSFMLRSKSALPQSVRRRIFMFVGT